MGFGNTVDHTTLSRANEKRDYRIYEELGLFLIETVRPMYADEKLDDIDTDLALLALDSTTISVSLKLCDWALGKYDRGNVKMHTLLDLRGGIPAQIYVSDGRWHDSNMLDKVNVEFCAVYVADKAYVDLEALRRIHLSGAFFVVRPKSNMKFVFKEERVDKGKDSNIVGDYVVELAEKKSRRLYPDELRFIRAVDPETGEIIDFITNNFDLSALDIANIYRHRWDIEIFFRWIKQNMVIKTLWGYSPNAVKTHLWVAICAYLFLAWVKKVYQSHYTVTEIATLVSVSLFEKADLKELLTAPIVEKVPKKFQIAVVGCRPYIRARFQLLHRFFGIAVGKSPDGHLYFSAPLQKSVEPFEIGMVAPERVGTDVPAFGFQEFLDALLH